MKDELTKHILNKLETIDNRLDGMSGTLIKQEENLRYHIERTDLLEEQVALVREELTPIKNVHTTLKLIGKSLLFLSSISILISYLFSLIH